MRDTKRKVTNDPVVLRIISELEKNHIMAKTLISEIGVGKNAFDSWKYGTSKSYMLYIDKIADFLGTSIDYLVRRQEMTSENLSVEEREIIDRYRMFAKGRKDFIKQMVSELWNLTTFENDIVSKKMQKNDKIQ